MVTAVSHKVDRLHRYGTRVYFEDTDAAGIVYYANYLRYIERARTELLRQVGFDHSTLMAGGNGIAFAVRHCDVDYLKPARLDDLLEIRTTVTEVRGASLKMSQSVWLGEIELVRVAVRLACITLDNRPARIPTAVSTALKQMAITA